MSGAGESYLSAFALFLKASSTQIALLASLPALLGSFAQLVSAWLGRGAFRRKHLILAGAFAQATMWLPLVLLPLLFPASAPVIIIVCVAIYYAMHNLAAPQWCSLMGDLVPERRRGRFFAMRTRVSTVVSFAALVASGLVLHFFSGRGETVIGYLAIFSVAMLARMVSVYHLTQMHDPPQQAAPALNLSLRRLLPRLRDSRIAQFSLFYAAMQFSVAIASPFFVVYMLRDLHFTYLEFMINTATSVFMQFLTLNMWGRLSDTFGNRLILVCTGMLIPFLPALWLGSTDFWYLIAVQTVGGICWAGFSLSAGNFLYDLVPGEKRTTYLALHNVLTSCGVFLGAMLGGFLAATLPADMTLGKLDIHWFSVFYWVFLISSISRLLVAGLFLPRLREVRSVKTPTVGNVIFRIARMYPQAWLNFDFLPTARRESNNREPLVTQAKPVAMRLLTTFMGWPMRLLSVARMATGKKT